MSVAENRRRQFPPQPRELAAVALLGLLALAIAQATSAQGDPAATSPPPMDRTGSKSAAPIRASSLDPSARLPKGGSASEQWDLMAVLDSGHRIAMRCIITNTGPGSRNAVVLGHVIRPGGGVQLFKQGRRSKRWTLSDDRRELDIGSTNLSLRDPRHRLRVSKPDVKIDLAFSPDTREATPPEATLPGYSLELLALSAQAEGTLWLPEMSEPLAFRGHAALVHSWTSESEGDVLHRRIDIHKLGDGPALYGLELISPRGEHARWLVASEAGKTLVSTTGFAVTLDGAIGDVEREGYGVPAGIQLAGPSTSGNVQLRKTLVQHDPLRVLPGFVRWVVSLTMKPHRVWAESWIDVTLRARSDQSPLRVQGTGVTTLTFLNPLNHR